MEGVANLSDETVIKLQWNLHEKRYYDAYVNAELLLRIRGVQTEMKYKHTLATPADMLDIVEDESRSTPKVKVLKCTPKESLLASPQFFEKIKNPVRIEVTVEPVAEAAMAAVMVTPEIKETCLIQIEPPIPTLHWRDEETGAEDTVMEIDADGEDELHLEVWVENLLPDGTYGKDDKAHFTHKTDQTMKGSVFGPRDNDKPWIVAKPGSGNRRTQSAWISKCALPSAKHPEYTLSHDGNLHVKAWAADAIADRIPNEIVRKPGAEPLVEQDIVIRLMPVKRYAYLVDPRVPLAADGQPKLLELEIRRQRDNQPVKHAEIGLELREGGGPPGGAIDITEKTLVPEDNGRVRVEFTPPELTYRRGTVYKNELVVTEGVGAAKTELSVIELHLNPKLEASIRAEKKELHFESESITIDSGEVPEFIKGTLAMDVVNGAPQIKRTYEVAHAKVWLESSADASDALGDGSGLPVDGQTAQTVTDTDTTTAKPGEVRSDSKGAFLLKLPELHAGWEFALQSPKELTLTKDQIPVCDFSPTAEEVIDRYDNSRINTRWYLYEGELNNYLRTHRLTYTAQLCRNPETDAPRILSGAELLRTGMVFSAGYERMFEQQFAQAVTNMGNLQGEIIGLAVNMFSWGDWFGQHLKWVGQKLVWLADSTIFRLIRWLTSRFMDFLSFASRKAAQWTGGASLTPANKMFIDGVNGTLAALSQAAGALPNLGFVDFFAGLGKLVMNGLKFLQGLLWSGYICGLRMMSAAAWATWDVASYLSGDRLRRWHQSYARWVSMAWNTASTDKASMGTWGIGKHAEWLTTQILNWAEVTGSSSEFLTESFRNKRVMTDAATAHVGAVWDDVFHLRVPEEPHTNRAEFIKGTSTLAADLQRLELRDIDMDLYMDWAETGLLCLEVLLAAGVVICSIPAAAVASGVAAAGGSLGAAGAVGAAGAAGTSTLTSFFVAQSGVGMSMATKVEVGASAIRSALRAVQTCVAFNNASGIVTTYGQRTEALTLMPGTP